MATEGIKTDDHTAHEHVLDRAMLIYIDRDELRGDLWRTRPIRHKLEMIREKHDRIQRGLYMLRIRDSNDEAIKGAITDDALDIINFAAFVVRLIEEGQVE